MEIKFVGVGGAFDINYTNSAAIVYLYGKRYLIDCGYSVFPQLVKNNAASSIDGVIVSHLHDDHIGSLSSFAFYTYYVLGKKLNILLPLHSNFNEKFRQLVSLTMVKYEKFFSIGNIDNQTIRCIETTGRHFEMESFAFLLSENETVIAYSGDLGDPNFLFDKIKSMSLNVNIVFHDICFDKIPAHSYYKDIMKWNDEFTILGYHCNPEQNPSDNTIPLVYNRPEFVL